MEAFTSHTGRAVPLRRDNVDTDTIIPAVYLKRVERTGFADGLFASWRRDGSFVLDRPEYAGASVLVAGRDFGTGSSREHAVWALQEHGFRVVVSSRFADIFRGNSLKAGLLAVQLPQLTVERLWKAVEADPSLDVTVDLVTRQLRTADALVVADFEIDDHTRRRLLEGLDDIDLTLLHAEDIAAYEAVTDDELFVGLSAGLRDAHAKLAGLAVEPGMKADLDRRLIAVTNSAKHDLRTAARRLERLADELDGLDDRA